MEVNFASYSFIAPLDAALRNAIKLESPELMQRAIDRGANINCQYPDEWNSPLHLAVASGDNRCASLTAVLMNHQPNYALLNRENFTAAELAIHRGLKSLGRQLLKAELGELKPVDALYVMLRRTSAEALEMLIEIMHLPQNELAQCLAKAWNKLEVMNVELTPTVETLAHMTLIRCDYGGAIGTGRGQKISETEIATRMELIIEAISCIEHSYDTSLSHDVNDEFLEFLRKILKHLFVVKNYADYFPGMQLEYCVAMYLAILDRKPELDLYQLVINKCAIVKFLKQLKRTYLDPQKIDTRMSSGILHKLVSLMHRGKGLKCKDVLREWVTSTDFSYSHKEQVMIRNKIAAGSLLSEVKCLQYSELDKKDQSLLEMESDSINRLFTTRRMRYRFKELYKLYFKIKQMYSIQKSVRCLNILEGLNLDTNNTSFASMLAIQRILQVLGETLKATKLSPNISTNLRSIMEFISPIDILSRISKLRQFFSHEYSSTKHSLYERLRNNEQELLTLYVRIKTDLMKVTPLLTNIYVGEITKFFNTFLGRILQLNTVEEVQSLANSCRIHSGFKIDCDLETTDVTKIDSLLLQLEERYDSIDHKENLAVIENIRTILKNYTAFLKSCTVDFMTELATSCIGNMILNDNLNYQKNNARYILKNGAENLNNYEYGAKLLITRTFNHLLNKLLELEVNSETDESMKRVEILQTMLEIASAPGIAEYHELVLGKNQSNNLEATNRVVQALQLELKCSDQLKELNKLLSKYYTNLFALDEKYRIIKTFCKRNKMHYDNTKASNCRKNDATYCCSILHCLLKDLINIVDIPPDMKELEFMSMLTALERYRTDSSENLALEIILLEVLEVLSAQCVDNRSSLTFFRSVITGRNLRNYLAHDSLVYETLCRNKNPDRTVILNAIYFIRYFNFTTSPGGHRSVSIADIEQWTNSAINQKVQLFQHITYGKFNFITKCCEIGTRTFDKRSLLALTFHQHSEDFIRFLLEHSTNLKPFFQTLLQMCPNQVHNFYDDDEFTVRQLADDENLRKNVSFYLAQKHEHFELENELDQLFKGVYAADSLNTALLFRNQRSALSIMNTPHLYDFCKSEDQRWDHTLLTQAVIRKLPAVIRRFCELSPEMIEHTNSAQEAPLYLAVATGCQESVQILLNFGAKVHTPLKSALVYAVRMRKDDLLEMMLPSDDELSSNQIMLGELIDQACNTNYHSLLRKLIPLAESSTILLGPLQLAALKNNVKVVDAILESNSNLVNVVSKNGRTALSSACCGDSLQTVRLLLRYGADCNLPVDNSALFCAIDRNYRSIVSLFLKENLIGKAHRATMVGYLLKKTKLTMAWMFFRHGYPCTISKFDIKLLSARHVQLLQKMCQLKPEITSQISSFMIVNAMLSKSQNFMAFSIESTFQRMSTIDRAQLLNGAIKKNDKELINSLLARGCNVNQPDLIGITPLGFAVSLGKPELVKLLIKAGADPNQETVANCDTLFTYWYLKGSTAFEQLSNEHVISYPLILAIFHRHRKVADFLLENVIAPDARDRRGLTALIMAIYCGDVQLVESLISHGSSVQYAQNFTHSIFGGATVLHAAAYFGHMDVLKLFIEKYKLDLAMQTKQGDTILHTAISGKQLETVEYLLKTFYQDIVDRDDQTLIRLIFEELDDNIFREIKTHPMAVKEIKSFIRKDGKRIFHDATENGSLSLLRALLNEFNVDIDQFDLHGNRAIYYAVKSRNLSKLKLLMEAGSSLFHVNDKIQPLTVVVNTNQIDALQLFLNQNGQVVELIREYKVAGYNLLQASVFKNNILMCELLLRFVEFDVNAAHKSGMTALHLASAYGSIQMVALLISHGSQLEVVTEDGKTPLVLAIEEGNTKVAEYLIMQKASVSLAAVYRYKTAQGMCLLHRVAMDGKLDMVKLLLNRNIFERIITDNTGKHLAHYAAANNRSNIIEYLIETSFPFDVLDDEGRSTMVSALEMNHIKLANRLKAHGSSTKIVQAFDETHPLTNSTNQSLNNFLHQEHSAAINCLGEIVKTAIGDTTNENESLLLRTAVDSKNTAEIERTIVQGKLSPDTKISNGQTVLHYCCSSNNLDAVKLLIDLGATIDSKDHEQATPVITSIINGNQLIAEFLISQGASTELIANYRMLTRDQETLLHVVSQKGFHSILNFLLQLNIFPIDVGDIDQTTALQSAAMHGRLECVELLLANGADPNFIDLETTNSLTRACIGCHKKIAELLLEHDVELTNTRNFRMKTQSNESLLHNTIYWNCEMIDLLIRRVGIDVNVIDVNNMTPLHYASRLGLIDTIHILLSLDANIDAVDCLLETPLIAAILAGFNEAAELLLERTTNSEPIEIFRSQQTRKPLIHIALEKGYYSLLIKMLTRFNLNSSVVDEDGQTILHHAVSRDVQDVIQWFNTEVQIFFQPDKSGMTPLGISLQKPNVEAFERILNSLDALLDNSHLIIILKTIVQLLASQYLTCYSKWLINRRPEFVNGNQQIIQIIDALYPSVIIETALLENNHDLLHLFLVCTNDKSMINCKNMPSGLSYLHAAALRNQPQIANLLLLHSSLLVDELDELNQTPLYYAALSNSLPTVEVLLDHGADVDLQNLKQKTPLMLAAENGNVEMVQLFLHFGADASLVQNYHYGNNSASILHCLAEKGFVELLPLLEPFLKVNCTDRHGMTPLHYAAICNQLAIVNWLHNFGARIDSTDNDGTTPLMRATCKGHIEIYRRLIEFGASTDLLKDFKNHNYDSETVLHIVAEKGLLEMTKLLVEDLQCDVNSVDRNGNSPLHLAFMKGRFEIIRYLLQKSANIDLRNNEGFSVAQLLESNNNEVQEGNPNE
ncbi:uncharacterized protein LOC128739915 [Sabethes cyaneus]|uniref:uncharacterized protein LOC128739915 n=1 Tax=Sabethes cyaneus TaxID=53552 RepID=UPI00237E5AD8|nr:uncharacterized protein LOC128739915 [Sabethes cyaneus]